MSIPQTGGGPVEHIDQLAEYLASGCKPIEEWRIGTEHEKFGYDKATLMPLPYEGPTSIKAMLEGLRDTYGWNPIHEGEHIIGLEMRGANISLEPGGQAFRRAAGDDPPDLRRGERTPARGAARRQPDRRRLHRPRRRPDLVA